MTNADTKTAATVAEQGARVAPDQASSNTGTTKTTGAPKGQKTAKAAKPQAAAPKKGTKTPKKAPKPAAAKKTGAPRGESKGAKILEMITRAKGATLSEIMKAADWQAHSVRGFISAAAKKHNLKIESSKSESGDRVYRIAK